MIAELKKSLSQCHLNGSDQAVQFLMQATPIYLITRAKEEMWAVNPENDPQVTEKQLRLSIQLLNIARYKLNESVRAAEVREAGTGSQNSG